MYEPNICPVCWAFQNPETKKCLVCGKAYNTFVGEPINLDEGNYITDYCIPIIHRGKKGYLTIRGLPSLTGMMDNSKYSFSFNIENHCSNEDEACAITLFD